MTARLQRAVLLAALAFAPGVPAQGFPDRPVRVIVPFPPGGLVDTFARTIQPRLSEALGQQAIIENRGDLFRDLVPVSLIARVPLTLVVPAGLPVNTAQEFAAYARARPGMLSYASPGSGVSYFAAEIFRGMAGIDMTHVPYKGGGPAMIDLMSGQVQALFTSVFVAAPQVKSGKIKGLAVASERRSPLLPQTPTFAESGYPDFLVASWAGLFVPTGVPAPVIRRLHADFAKALRSPEVEARFQELGAEGVGSSPEQLAALVKREYDTFGKLIRELKISVN
jgi:tripartite-type tricarboxylate transporter receptor subunit TctC